METGLYLMDRELNKVLMYREDQLCKQSNPLPHCSPQVNALVCSAPFNRAANGVTPHTKKKHLQSSESGWKKHTITKAEQHKSGLRFTNPKTQEQKRKKGGGREAAREKK